MTTSNTKPISKEIRISNNDDQFKLETAVLRYQTALAQGKSREIDNAYAEVCRIYPPLNFVHVWYKKYHHLYDTKEDFVQEYLFKFCKVLAGWKPRHLRKESQYNGKGTFANYFWGALDKMYANQIKAEAAAKRSLSTQCPICEHWCTPLSTHLLLNHKELLLDKIQQLGVDITTYIGCPLCKSHKCPSRISCEHSSNKKTPCVSCINRTNTISLTKHLFDKHSSLLFERFRELYPNHVTLSVKPMSVNSGEDDDGTERNLYDVFVNDEGVNNLLSSNLTELQRKIVEAILLQRSTEAIYDAKLYKCTVEEFNKALDSLRETMTLIGLGDDDTDEQY